MVLAANSWRYLSVSLCRETRFCSEAHVCCALPVRTAWEEAEEEAEEIMDFFSTAHGGVEEEEKETTCAHLSPAHHVLSLSLPPPRTAHVVAVS